MKILGTVSPPLPTQFTLSHQFIHITFHGNMYHIEEEITNIIDS